MVSAEPLMSSKESQGMQVGVEANQADGSGTSPKPVMGLKFDLDESLLSGFFPPSLLFFPPM